MEAAARLPFSDDFPTILLQTFYGLLSLSSCSALWGGVAVLKVLWFWEKFRVGVLFLLFSSRPFFPSQRAVAQGTIAMSFFFWHWTYWSDGAFKLLLPFCYQVIFACVKSWAFSMVSWNRLLYQWVKALQVVSDANVKNRCKVKGQRSRWMCPWVLSFSCLLWQCTWIKLLEWRE